MLQDVTRKLYNENAELSVFEAEVCAYEERAVLLDCTAFFPEAGGQSGDRGTIFVTDREGTEIALPVCDVQIEDGIIRHILADEADERGLALLTKGAHVRGEVDDARRFDFMQQHTGEHIVSGLVHRRFGYDNTGFRLSDHTCTMDYNGMMCAEDVADIELEANRVVFDNTEVVVSFPTEEEQARLNYRSKKEIASDELRIVTIEGTDCCACCAPHVKRTGEVGLIKILRLQNWKGGVRLYIACGQRALSLFRAEHDMITELAKQMSTSWDNIPDRFRKMREETGALKKELKTLKRTAGGSNSPVREVKKTGRSTCDRREQP